MVKGIENRRGKKGIPLGESDRNGKAGIPVGKIRGAVERINVPAKVRSRSALMPGSRFGSNGVVGKVLGQPFDDEPSRALVRVGNDSDCVAVVNDARETRQVS